MVPAWPWEPNVVVCAGAGAVRPALTQADANAAAQSASPAASSTWAENQQTGFLSGKSDVRWMACSGGELHGGCEKTEDERKVAESRQ